MKKLTTFLNNFLPGKWALVFLSISLGLVGVGALELFVYTKKDISYQLSEQIAMRRAAQTLITDKAEKYFGAGIDALNRFLTEHQGKQFTQQEVQAALHNAWVETQRQIQ
jgi:hypothetical protein